MLSRVSASSAARASAAVAARHASARAVSSSSSASTATAAAAAAAAAGLLRRRVAVAAAAAAAPTISPASGMGIPTASAAVSEALSTQARGFSSSSSVHSSSTASLSIPTRHSRHLPRPVCTDSAELESTTSQLLASRPGSLFTYEFTTGSSSNGSSNKADEYEAGLVRSDVTTQKFEWTLGGHAARIPGTVAASANSTNADKSNASDSVASKHLDAMVQLLERIEEEGRIYVELRARVLNQQYSDSNTAASSDSSDNSSDSSSSDCDSDSDSDTDTAAQSQSNSKSQSAWRIQSLINRYGAAPGPSVHMYDALLDAIACCAEAEADSKSSKGKASMEYLILARSVYERAMARHHADGGPNANNRLTMPTLITYNAVLRTCAAVEYQHDNSNEEVRDAALDLAFAVYDALNTNSNSNSSSSTSTSNAMSKGRSSKKVGANTTANIVMPQRNSATYVHMLRVIAKYLPPSSTRGNVAHGLWLSCTGHDGVLDGQVIQAYVEANTRNGSNGQQYDDFVAKLTGVESMQENSVLRQNWWRNRKSRRMGIDAEGY